MRYQNWRKRLPLVLAIALALSIIGVVAARSSGRIGLSGNPATNGGATCNSCHNGGLEPVVDLIGPTVVRPGQKSTYSLVISGGQRAAGGFNVSATNGEIAVLPGATDTRIEQEPTTMRNEITHTAPKDANAAGRVVFSFTWTAPGAPSQITLYGAGNSVNRDGGPGGDAAAVDVLPVRVMNVADTLFLPVAVGR